MKVTPLLPGDVVKCYRQVIDRPPYVVVGVASQSFLARIDLAFNEVAGRDFGEQEGQTFSLEHWVDVCSQVFFAC